MDPLLPQLAERYEAVAMRYVSSWIGDSETVADIYQSVLQSLLESSRDFASLEHLRNYFFVALRNAAFDHLRARGRAASVMASSDTLDAAAADADCAPESRLVAAEEVAEQKARRQLLQDALASLTQEERNLIKWRYWERKTFQAIKDLTGVPISTLKSREDTILRKIRKLFRKSE